MLIWMLLFFAAGEPKANSSGTLSKSNTGLRESQITGREVNIEAAEWTIRSDYFSYDIERSEAVFSNNVVFEQENFVLTAGKVTVQSADDKTRQIVAEGGVRIEVMGRLVTSAAASYFPEQQMLRCSGSVMIDSPQQILTGEDIEIELKKEIRCRQNCGVQWK